MFWRLTTTTAVFLAATPLHAQQTDTAREVGQAPHVRDEIARAAAEVIDSHGLRIEGIDLGAPSPGANKFSATVHNRTDRSWVLTLDLRADPGFWLRKWQRQFSFEVTSGASETIETVYQYEHMTEEAWLRVRLSIAQLDAAGSPEQAEPIFQARYALGGGNPAVDYTFAEYDRYATEHFDIYVYGKYLSPQAVTRLMDERELAYSQIAELLSVEYTPKVRLFLFPDSASKTSNTGHIGFGWATDNNIVEIYNERIKLDPYHELTHILADPIGDPPALFDEGLAMHMTERFGASQILLGPDTSLEAIVRGYASSGQLVPLDSLFAFTDIGSPETRPLIAYPQAASIVGYLIETYGLERFRDAFARLANTSDPAGVRKNEETLNSIYGLSIPALEAAWLDTLHQER